VNKKRQKEYERLKRERAERKAKTRRESDDRRERIKVLWGLNEQNSKPKPFKEWKTQKQDIKERKLKGILNLIERLTEDDTSIEALQGLVELAGLQDSEIEYLTQFRSDWELICAHYPEQLEELKFQSVAAELRPHMEARRSKLTPKQRYERERRRHKLGQVGEIEREFGGGFESSFPPLSCYEHVLGIFRSLDDIFAGNGVSMLSMQDLFGLHRDRFPKKLPSFKMGRETLYDYRAVTKIMDWLLSEKLLNDKRQPRGRRKRLWLSDTGVRRLALSRIEARMHSLSVSEPIKAAFLAVVRRHLPDSAK
jgi:hypothetical protein